MIENLEIEMTKPETAQLESISGLDLLNKLADINKKFENFGQLEGAKPCETLRNYHNDLKKIMG